MRSLAGALEEYARFRAIRKTTRYQMSRAIALFSEWLQYPARVADLSDSIVSEFLEHLETTHSRRTVAGHRVSLLALWRDCAERCWCDPPGRVRRVTRPDPCPVAWTLDELRAIRQQCGTLAGKFPSGAARAAYCVALVDACYESGLRRSDIWSIKRNQIRQDGAVIMRQAKTGRRHYPRLRPATVARLADLPGDPPLRCPYRSTSAWYKFWHRHVIGPAGVRPGSLQQLRRTGATHLAREAPHAVQRYLGHRTPDMQRHYVDESIACPQVDMPPAIGDT